MAGFRAGLVLILALGLATTGCQADGEREGAPARAVSQARPAVGSALEGLDRLPVKGRAPKTGYSRDRFGHGWLDTDRDGCDQRNQVLARDLIEVRYKQRTRQCVVLSGQLNDPYTGALVQFRRGARTSTLVQIDHVVSLSDAWQTGAAMLTDDERQRLATDLIELLAVSGSVNESKRDGDAATWLPPSRGYRCRYVARQVAVKLRYRLWVTPAEHDAIGRVLTDCPGEPLPAA
jgi:hypothetical protein